MGRTAAKQVVLLLLTAYCLLPVTAHAQRTLGVVWEIPESRAAATAELDRFQELNITVLEVDEIASDPVWEEIVKRDFRVYLQIPVTYPVPQTFSQPDSSLLNTYQSYLSGYSGRDIRAIGAYRYGLTQNPGFTDALAPYLDQLRSSVSLPIYDKRWSHRSSYPDSLLDFSIADVRVDSDFRELPGDSFTGEQALIYLPSSHLRDHVAPLKWFLDKTASVPETLLFFRGDWLLDFLETNPSVDGILGSYATESDPLFPLPSEQLPRERSADAPVLILLIIWTVTALTYSFIPMYRRALFRFFLSHKFFAEDVMKRHIRDIVPSLILLMQHALLGGLMLYVMALNLFSASGIQVMASYFPILTIFGSSYFIFFLIGTLVTLFIEIFCLAWLYFANGRVGHLSQVSILYSWPFHLNLMIATVTVTLIMAEGNTYLAGILFWVFWGVLLADFPITAWDTGRRIKRKKGLYLAGTFGIYILLILSALISLMGNGYFWNILELASSIS